MDNDSFVTEMNIDEYLYVPTPTPPDSNSLMNLLMPPSIRSNSNGEIVIAQEVVPSPAPAPSSPPSPPVTTADNNSVIKWLVSLEEERQHAESEKKIRNEKENSIRLIQYYWRNYIQVKQRRFRESVELSISNITRRCDRHEQTINQIHEDVGNLSRRIDSNHGMILDNSRRIEECSGRIEELQIAINEINEKINQISGSLEWKRETQNMFDPNKIYRAVRTDGGSKEGNTYYPLSCLGHCLLFEFSGMTKGRIDYTDKTKMRQVHGSDISMNLIGSRGYRVVVEYLPIIC